MGGIGLFVLAISMGTGGAQARPAPTKVPPEVVAFRHANELLEGLGILFMDNGNRVAVRPARWSADLTPYLRSTASFTAPPDRRGTLSFSFNGALAGSDVATIARPDRTVLIYLGKNRRLDFRYRGRSLVGFLDGRARAVTPQEARALIWEPRPQARRKEL